MATVFAYRFGVEPDGNVHHDPHGEFMGKNILYVRHTIEETAQNFHLSEETVTALLAKAIPQLLDARSKRIRPHLDDKVLTGWSGLMTSALAQATHALHASTERAGSQP